MREYNYILSQVSEEIDELEKKMHELPSDTKEIFEITLDLIKKLIDHIESLRIDIVDINEWRIGRRL